MSKKKEGEILYILFYKSLSRLLERSFSCEPSPATQREGKKKNVFNVQRIFPQLRGNVSRVQQLRFAFCTTQFQRKKKKDDQ